MNDLLTTTARSTQRFLSDTAAPQIGVPYVMTPTGRRPEPRMGRWTVIGGVRYGKTAQMEDLIEIDYAALEQRILGWFS